MTAAIETGLVGANGTRLYYESRGDGQPLLFIPGAEGDAEEYARVADLLSDEFEIVSYDRRGFSRSESRPRPEGTTVEEQVEDVAALLRTLDKGPAILWGNSSGAIIGLGLLLTYPDLVVSAMLHEPPLFAGMTDPQNVAEFSKRAAAGGKVPLLRMLSGDAVFDGLPPAYRQRLAADQTWIDHEFDKFEYYEPPADRLALVTQPVAVLYGAEALPFLAEAATWLAGELGVEVSVLPGNHGVHYALPTEVADFIRRFTA
jgi:pimeloyl-ACP methyl ester carboxylesterase